MRNPTRRDVLRWGGVALSLPLLPSLAPRRAAAAALPSKTRFVGCFFPSGAAMPDGTHGDWALTGALAPIVDRGLAGNVAVLRGFRSVEDVDVHWSGTAAFMSCNRVGRYTGSSLVGERCGKSFDQYIADLQPTKLRSLNVGWGHVPGWDEGHDSVISIQYVNSIAWRDERNPISNTRDPMQLFTRVFGDGTTVADPHIAYLLDRKESILDGVLDQLARFRAGLPSDEIVKMDAYESGIRDVERELTAQRQANTCNGDATVDNDVEIYVSTLKTMQNIIVRAFECDAARSATIMYHEGIGDTTIGTATIGKQHEAAHGDWNILRQINRIQVGLWADFLAQLKASSLLEQTVVTLGSNMSDGRTHRNANIPMMVASAGPELRLGQEVVAPGDVTNPAQNRNLADVYVDLFKLYGVNKPVFGEDQWKSTGVPSGVLAGT
ncbi:MAG: DUF1552 domain-containing protein [Myxococcota bacterium]|nr:DUF1552 domain-containing protein [Myxococcota bacterium]